MNLTPFAVIWACLAMAVLEIATAHKLDVIDHWEKILMITAVVTGVLLGAAYLYQLWVESQKPLA